MQPDQSKTEGSAAVDLHPLVMPRREVLTNFPGMKASAESRGKYFGWRASYDDDSGAVEGWAPTMRGAKQQAVNQCRRKSGNYSKINFKWHNAEVSDGSGQ